MLRKREIVLLESTDQFFFESSTASEVIGMPML